MLKSRFQEDALVEIGVDEAGRGPLWGPMMAGAVLLPKEESWTESMKSLAQQIKDSKKLTAKKRKLLKDEIMKCVSVWGIGQVSAEEIDTLGATRANQLVFRRALQDLYSKCELQKEKRILIDGILPLNDVKSGEEIKTIIEGDAKYLSIAAASILAKVVHDDWVTEWCKDHVADAAKYDLLNCKGYGTAKHREGILKYGYTDLHRRLYLRKLVPGIVVSRHQFIEDMSVEDISNDQAI
jgi:ribonuclease HII